MKSLVASLLVVVLIVAACAPVAGRPVLRYHATAEEIISTIAEIGVTMQPSAAYNFYSITGISDRFITLQATTTLGVALLLGGHSVTLTFSASQSGDVVSLAASAQGDPTLGNESIDNIIQQLDARFDRAPLF